MDSYNMNPEDFPDKTVDELRNSDDADENEFADDLESKEVVEKERTKAFWTMAMLGTEVMLAEMLEANKITLREYIRLTNYAEKYEKELGIGV